MAGRGPAPKPASDRRRRNADPVAETVVSDDAVLRGPALPDGHPWPSATLAWWETWRRSPQAQAFTATDWDFLLDTAVLHADFWSGNGSVAAELRLRVAKFGATPEDRARLRMQVDGPEPVGSGRPAPKPSQGADRRARLLKVVGDGA